MLLWWLILRVLLGCGDLNLMVVVIFCVCLVSSGLDIGELIFLLDMRIMWMVWWWGRGSGCRLCSVLSIMMMFVFML